jgi:hypothetical protein
MVHAIVGVSLKEHCGQDHPHLNCCRNQFNRTQPPNILQDIQDNIHCMWACTILLEKHCVHMTCFLNDLSNLILQLLEVPLVCYGAFHKHKSNKPCLLTALHTVHFSGWSDISITLCKLLAAQNLMFCLFINGGRIA